MKGIELSGLDGVKELMTSLEGGLGGLEGGLDGLEGGLGGLESL